MDSFEKRSYHYRSFFHPQIRSIFRGFNKKKSSNPQRVLRLLFNWELLTNNDLIVRFKYWFFFQFIFWIEVFFSYSFIEKELHKSSKSRYLIETDTIHRKNSIEFQWEVDASVNKTRTKKWNLINPNEKINSSCCYLPFDMVSDVNEMNFEWNKWTNQRQSEFEMDVDVTLIWISIYLLILYFFSFIRTICTGKIKSQENLNEQISYTPHANQFSTNEFRFWWWDYMTIVIRRLTCVHIRFSLFQVWKFKVKSAASEFDWKSWMIFFLLFFSVC